MSPLELTPEHFPIALSSSSAPTGRITIRAPFDERAIATIDTVGMPHIDDALERARSLHEDRAGHLPVHQRAAILLQAAQLLEANAQALAVEAAREGGKPLLDSQVEVARAADGLR